MKPNYGTLINPDKLYPVTYTITQDGKKIFKKGKLKGCDLTENQVKELLANPKAKIIISHGGQRPNSGRKPGSSKEHTKQIRVPESLVPTVKEMIIRHKSQRIN